MAIRFDKYIWSVRLAKTRSIASDLIAKGKIKLNNNQVKPSREIKVGDFIQVLRNTAVFEYKILETLEQRVGAKLVQNYLLNVTKPEELERFKTYQFAQSTYRNYGTGRPNKHDRQQIDDFLIGIEWDDDEDL